MKSLGQMVERISNLADTKDVNDWEDGFIKSIWAGYLSHNRTTGHLSEKQIASVEKIFNKHYGD